MHRVGIFACAVVCGILWNPALSSAATPVVSATSLTILPGDFTLYGPACRQSLVVERRSHNDYVGQIAPDEVTYQSGNEKIVRLENGTAIPVADGTTTITAKHPSGTATVNVKVVDMAKPFTWSFRNHVESVLLKTDRKSVV